MDYHFKKTPVWHYGRRHHGFLELEETIFVLEAGEDTHFYAHNAATLSERKISSMGE